MKRPIDIERLCQWAYSELDKAGSEAWSPWDMILRLGRLGTRYDDDQFGSRFRLPAIFGDCHPDARMVARYVERLDHPACALVASCAAASTRPKPHKGPPGVFPVMSGSKYWVSHKSNGRGSKGDWRYYPEGAYCRIEFRPSVEQIEASRTEYRIWRYALARLTGRLLGQLRDYEPIGPAAPLEPWSEPVSTTRVLHSLTGPPNHL